MARGVPGASVSALRRRSHEAVGTALGSERVRSIKSRGPEERGDAGAVEMSRRPKNDAQVRDEAPGEAPGEADDVPAPGPPPPPTVGATLAPPLVIRELGAAALAAPRCGAEIPSIELGSDTLRSTGAGATRP